ncbi:T9SS type B sorting domain-containing protein [Cryomorpha ignava]|uniref:T9SS type B sorting domain-containing protein n=1 Tax=Cryomorpha ignava TaxID=101383 RepID=A0A7K3WRL9_9FLAO|nr:gliding motility-associated C-terminal domain-containing protein [Cryomorpha ignava]NEN23691.1 T9SS type B sorting domain-containing protein [Cryomorpha ignava]
MRLMLVLLCTFYFASLSAQTYWAKKEAGSNVDETLAVTGDNLGNTYTTGYFSGLASIDGVTKVVSGLTDIFISKISANGTTTWVVAAGGSSSDRGLGIAVDNDQNVIVSGFYSGTINFGSGISISSNAGSQDAFVAKYASSGTIIWAKSGGSSGNSDRANAVAVDNSGNIFITGQFNGEASFGNLSLSSLNNSIDAFIVKYDAAGNELWAKKGSGTAIDRGLSITTDNSGSAYAVGQFSDDITFDNLYSNTILNALFIIKYSSSGSEEWFRYAGGSEQSIANSVTSDGSNIFLTGDFGNSITFLGSGNSTLNSGYANAVFLASYSPSGSLLWKQSQGSSSAVSARGISINNGQIGVAGWHECTFESLSDIYGEATFNSLGYKDVFVMRYSSSGAFDFARNFGSPTDEIATGIHVQIDGKEVITGVYREKLYIPVGSAVVAGLTDVIGSPNVGLTYCGDSNYGRFGKLESMSGFAEDGFTIRAINPNRAPLDMYKRFGSGCDLSIPDACIGRPATPLSYTCEDLLIGCSPFLVHAINFVPVNSEIGFMSNYSWSPPNNISYFSVTQPGDLSVTITSKDGCYTSTASVVVDIYPAAISPLLSDDAGVNNLASNPSPIFLCPGDEVDLWCEYEPGYTFFWTGPGIDVTGQTNNETVTVSQPGVYHFNVVSPDGCSKGVAVQVFFIQVPPENLEPYLNFGIPGDTVLICGSATASVAAYDYLTDDLIPHQPYDFTWSITPPGGIFGTTALASITISESGWYTITLEIETEDNPCLDEPQIYTVSDSVYALLRPVPVVEFTLTGPGFTCPGDTITLYTEYSEGTPTFNFNVIEDFGDSLYVYGDGNYNASLTITNEFGCSTTKIQTLVITTAPTPSIIMLPETGAICPGDSILLVASSAGTPQWQGPSGNLGNQDSLYVSEAGLYYAEVTFYAGCALVSNTVQISEYSTPFLEGSGGVLCQGDTIEISIVSTSITNISWQDPFSGSDTSQVVTQPGIYTVQVTSCNIVSEISIEVSADTNSVFIQQPDLTPVCEGDSILIEAIPADYPQYSWTQPGSDSEIYVTSPGTIQATVIDEFNCTLLSNVIQIDFEPIPPLPVFQFAPICEGENQIVNIAQPYAVNYTDGLNGAVLQNNPQFTIPSFYGDTTLFAYLNSQYCIGPADSITISAKPYPDEPILVTDAPVCTGTSLNLVVINSEPNVVYQWLSPTGSIFTGNDVDYGVSNLDDEGIYYCHANLAGCISDTALIEVALFETRRVILPPDTNMCYKADFSVKPTETFATYLWQDGSEAAFFKPSESADLFLITTDENGCQSVDEMRINIVDCTVTIPNIFTPNGDGYNDGWIGTTEDPLFYKVVVYNRWGRIVFESNSVNNAWDGTHYKTNEPCSEGVYFYILRLNNFEGMAFEQTGNVTLIRE